MDESRLPVEHVASQAEIADDGFGIARFEYALGLPDDDAVDFSEVRQAVRREYLDASRQKKLTCRKVSAFVDGDRGVVHVIEVDGPIDFEWTWEGATAYRPASMDGSSRALDASRRDAENEQDLPPTGQILWSGEILEVDEDAGQIFIHPKDPEIVPSVGEFLVQPFEFLAGLNEVYHHDAFAAAQASLPSRLAATLGNVYPVLPRSHEPGLKTLTDWWQHSWSILWGPPGTGKTYTTGRQIAEVLRNARSVDPPERILVVSTTNQATDEVAVSIGKAVQQTDGGENRLAEGTLQRIGKGASLKKFRSAKLMSMLAGKESELMNAIDRLTGQLRQTEDSGEKAKLNAKIKAVRAELSDASGRTFLDASVKVVVATSFKATQLLKNEVVKTLIENREAPFTTIFIDEAGLISRAAVAVLSLLASRRVVLVGDSKQLAPISRVARTLPSRKAKWLASSGLSHLSSIQDHPPSVHVLTRQYRMHSTVCEAVSNYQYGGQLTTADQRVAKPSTLVPSLAGFARAIWYVLDEEPVPLHRIRASRGPGNRSWIRHATGEVLQKLFEDDGVKSSRGLFISPFRAQADAVAKLFTQWEARFWTASTVHCQQGSESDIVIFDSVNAGNPVWPIAEWQRLVNVALSRAREAVIVLASRSEIEEPHLRPLAKTLTPAVLKQIDGTLKWRQVSSTGPRPAKQRSMVPRPVTESPSQAGSPNHDDWQPGHKLGHQFDDRKQLRPVLSREQQRLSNLRIDGKPRIVRGVAGSGKSFVLSNWVAKTAESFEIAWEIDDGSKEPRRIWAVFANRSLK